MDAKCCYGCMKAKRESPVCEHCGYDERTQNAPHQLPTGTILQGKYLLGRVLGQGGFGITYLGRDIALDIPVAIKEYYPTGVVTRECSYSHSVILATGAEDTRFAENRDRFLREARTLARLEDVPEVVQVKSFFTENNTAYIVMGYVKGITLKEHMRHSGGKLSPSEVFRLLEPVLEALGQVHELGLVHRDISPDNIMLQPNKRARLIDFGAAHTATLPGGTSTQAVLKHGFAPVEQYQSKGHLGSWTDVYAMCATIYHCITGLMPPNATDRIMGEEDFRWEALSCLTQAQQAALRQGLELQYRERIQTMDELCAKLFSGEEPAPQPKPIPRPEPVPQPKPTPMPEPKPQPKPEEPSVSETGTVELIRKNTDDIPTVLTAPVVQKEPAYTAPVQRPESYTTPVKQVGSYTAPVQQEESHTAPVVQEQPATETGEAQPAPAEPEKKPEQKQKKKPWIWIAVGIILVLLFAINQISFATSQKIPDGSRVLMTHFNMSESAFRTGVNREDVLHITFLNTEEAPRKAVDVSQSRDGSVVAWAEAVEGGYDLYLAAKGYIILPQDCRYMFARFSGLTELDLSDFDTGNVIGMNCMFSGCSNLAEIDVSGFDTGNVTDMDSMFSGCSNLAELDVSVFDTGNVTDMGSMFSGCSNLVEMDISGFDTRNVTDMSFMFSHCQKMTKLDVSVFVTVNVTNMRGMFSGCSNLTELNLSGFDTRYVTNMSYMFSNCSNLTKLDLSGFDTGKVTDMGSMFYHCSNLTELDVSGFDTCNVTDMSHMFWSTDKLTNVNGNFDLSCVTDYGGFMDSDDTFNGRPWKKLL